MSGSAVVQGAGGPVGIAWEIGVATGLADRGLDIRDADLFIGTSAGSVVAAKLASELGFENLFEEQINPETQVKELTPPIDWGPPTRPGGWSMARSRSPRQACPMPSGGG